MIGRLGGTVDASIAIVFGPDVATGVGDGAGTAIPRPSSQGCRWLRRGRRARHSGTHGRAATKSQPRPAVLCRKPHWRQRNHRNALGGAIKARWLHAAFLLERNCADTLYL